MAENKNLKTLTLPNAQGELVKYDLAPKWEKIEGKPESFPSDLTQASGILPIEKGGTGNSYGYIRTGAKEGTVIGDRATAEGVNTTASGDYSHSEGNGTSALGNYSHAQGQNTIAQADWSHAEGYASEAHGICSHAENRITKAIGEYSHAEGDRSEARGAQSHAEGSETISSGYSSHAEGTFSKAAGDNSHAEGYNTNALGNYSHAQGQNTIAQADWSHAEGYASEAQGICSHAENRITKAIGEYSHAEGDRSEAHGAESHAEGAQTIANGSASHAEGNKTKSTGYASHTEGAYSIASGGASHAEGGHFKEFDDGDHLIAMGGSGTKATGHSSHAEGSSTIASGKFSHAEGYGTLASGEASHASGSGKLIAFGKVSEINDSSVTIMPYSSSNTTIEIDDLLVFQKSYDLSRERKVVEKISDTQYILDDSIESDYTEVYKIVYTVATGKVSRSVGYATTATGNYSSAEGYLTHAAGEGSHAEGSSSQAIGIYSHAEGYTTSANGKYSHAEGDDTNAEGENSHAEGSLTQAVGYSSHAEGETTKAEGSYSHSEGFGTAASNIATHAEGYETQANGKTSHAEGHSSIANGQCSHAEGHLTRAEGQDSHSEGYFTQALGSYSHAEGYSTTASGSNSHAEGFYTIASADAQHVQGRYNIEDTAKTYAHIVGNGNSTNRSNAHAIDWDGNANFAGDVYVGNANENKAGNKLATESFVTNKIAEAQLNSGGDVDLSGYATKDDLNSRVPTSRTVNGKALSSNVTLSASDVKARADTWNPSFLTDKDQAGYRNGLQYSGSPTNPLYMAVWDVDESATGTQPNRRVRSINAEGARELIGAAPAGYGLGAGGKAIASGDNLNNYKVGGFYQFTSGVANTPTSYGMMLVIPGTGYSNDTFQYVFSRYPANKIYLRQLFEGTWQDWVDCSPSAGMIREFNSGAINVAPNVEWSYNGNASKIYVVTVSVTGSGYHSFVIDWQALNSIGSSMAFYATVGGKSVTACAEIVGSSIKFWSFGCNIINICGYY